MGRHTDFWTVTGDALDYAMASLAITDAALRDRLMQLYLELDAYAEVPAVLARLRAARLKTAILSDGSPAMLDSAVRNAGIADHFDAVLSVEQVGIFKPHPSTYQMAVDGLSTSAAEIAYLSSNAWDASAAATFVFRVVWINRFGQARERLADEPDVEIAALDELPAIVGVA